MRGASAVTGVILAGGLGRRMGGVDKGLQMLDGEPLVAHVIRRFAPQVGSLIINANQHAQEYAAFGYPVLADRIPGFAGPLAGLQTALLGATTPWVATAPCDSPFLPLDLVDRLQLAAEAAGRRLAVAVSAGRRQPVFCLCARDLGDELTAFLAAGERRFETWCARVGAVDVEFPDRDAFANINTLAELAGHARPAAG